jgi:hypothetical protein
VITINNYGWIFLPYSLRLKESFHYKVPNTLFPKKMFLATVTVETSKKVVTIRKRLKILPTELLDAKKTRRYSRERAQTIPPIAENLNTLRMFCSIQQFCWYHVPFANQNMKQTTVPHWIFTKDRYQIARLDSLNPDTTRLVWVGIRYKLSDRYKSMMATDTYCHVHR